jgi:iron complex transport system permease protein
VYTLKVFSSLIGELPAKRLGNISSLTTDYLRHCCSFSGMGPSISGLLMQTLFRNPLAGPYVLGLSSGASLGVAMVILGVAFLPETVALLSSYGVV